MTGNTSVLPLHYILWLGQPFTEEALQCSECFLEEVEELSIIDNSLAVIFHLTFTGSREHPGTELSIMIRLPSLFLSAGDATLPVDHTRDNG